MKQTIYRIVSGHAGDLQNIDSNSVRKVENDFFDWRLRESPEFSSKYGLGKYYDRVEEWNQAAFDRRKVHI